MFYKSLVAGFLVAFMIALLPVSGEAYAPDDRCCFRRCGPIARVVTRIRERRCRCCECPGDAKPPMNTPEDVTKRVQDLVKLLSKPLKPMPEIPADIADLLGGK